MKTFQVSVLLFLFLGEAFAKPVGFHLEYGKRANGWVKLHNDSHLAIEAFSYTSGCGEGGSSYVTSDLLDSPSQGSWNQPDLTFLRAAIEPGEDFYVERYVPPLDGCSWRATVHGVIYADGTYEGEKNSVRNLQARRDGILAALQHWAMLYNEAQGKGTGDLYADAEQLSRKDLEKQGSIGCLSFVAACSYWAGRDQVDRNIALQVKRNRSALGPVDIPRYVEKWLEKTDSDVALKTLQSVFPFRQKH